MADRVFRRAVVLALRRLALYVCLLACVIAGMWGAVAVGAKLPARMHEILWGIGAVLFTLLVVVTVVEEVKDFWRECRYEAELENVTTITYPKTENTQ